MNLTAMKDKNTKNKIPVTAGVQLTRTEHNGAEISDSLFNDAEFDFAATHASKIKSLGIRQNDKALVAIPMSEKSWLEVIECCIYAGADFILPDAVSEISSLASAIEREEITMIATTSRIWPQILRKLSANPGNAMRLRVIIYNDREELDSQYHIIPAGLSNQ